MNNEPMLSDQIAGWAYGMALAAVAFLLLVVLGGYGIATASFFAAILFAVIGGLIVAIFCTPLPKPGEVPPPGMRHSTKPVSTKPVSTKPVSAKPATAPRTASAPGPTAAPKKAAQKTTSKAAAPKPAADAAPSAGTQPQALAAARDGGPDNLKEIKGVGPKLETLCHDLGIYHFDQIAGWGPEEIAWMDENLKGFKGRVTRDNWVDQAKTLAAGGETEFSKRVDEGDVY